MKNNNTSFQVQAHALTDKGRRPNNEDFVTSFEPTDPQERLGSGCIYIVADGVGGASVGERASKYAAEKVLYEYYQHPEIEPRTRLKQVITTANREIFQYSKEKGIRMATTMTVAVVLNNSLIVANVGDSRAYLIRGNEVSQITRDHNIVGELVRDGVMTEAEALKSKAKNRLTRSIGGDEEVHVDIFGPIPLQAGDKIVMCSDGLTRYALKEDIANLAISGSPKQITENLVAFAKERGHGGADNISVITVAYEPSADFAVTIQRPRPMAPEQPLEIIATEPTLKPQASRPQARQRLALAAIGLLGIVILGGTTMFIANGLGVIPLFGETPTVPLTPSLEVSSLTPTFTPPAPTVTSVTPTSTVEEQTTTEALVTGTIDCTKVNGLVNIRDNPSEVNTNRLGRLICEDNVTLTGRYIPEGSDRDWYRISFTQDDQIIDGWIIANRVTVLEGEKDRLQLLSYEGIPVTATPSPLPTLSSLPLPTTQAPAPKLNQPICIYTVKAGDRLSEIAQKFGVADLNSIDCKLDSIGCDLSDKNRIDVGWQLIIPGVPTDLCTSNGGVLQ